MLDFCHIIDSKLRSIRTLQYDFKKLNYITRAKVTHSFSDSISNHSEGESIELEIDDYNFKDCSITRKVNPRARGKDPRKTIKKMSANEKTRRFLDQVDEKVMINNL